MRPCCAPELLVAAEEEVDVNVVVEAAAVLVVVQLAERVALVQGDARVVEVVCRRARTAPRSPAGTGPCAARRSARRGSGSAADFLRRCTPPSCAGAHVLLEVNAAVAGIVHVLVEHGLGLAVEDVLQHVPADVGLAQARVVEPAQAAAQSRGGAGAGRARSAPAGPPPSRRAFPRCGRSPGCGRCAGRRSSGPGGPCAASTTGSRLRPCAPSCRWGSASSGRWSRSRRAGRRPAGPCGRARAGSRHPPSGGRCRWAGRPSAPRRCSRA